MAKAKKEVSAEVIEKVGGVEYLQRAIIKDEVKNIELEVIVSVPDRVVVGEYMKYSHVNPKKAQEILVKNCLHTDLDQVMASRHLFMGAVAAIAEIMPLGEVRLGKY